MEVQNYFLYVLVDFSGFSHVVQEGGSVSGVCHWLTQMDLMNYWRLLKMESSGVFLFFFLLNELSVCIVLTLVKVIKSIQNYFLF